MVPANLLELWRHSSYRGSSYGDSTVYFSWFLVGLGTTKLIAQKGTIITALVWKRKSDFVETKNIRQITCDLYVLNGFRFSSFLST